MLASITPLGERGRRQRWEVTVIAFVVSATAAGAGAGAVLGLFGALSLTGVGADARLLALAVVVAVAVCVDATGLTVPGPRRQVDERWRDRYRGWVYGTGYGAQLGVGVTTVVRSAATYVALTAAWLVGDPGRGALVMGCYGAVRGLSLLAGAWVRGPDQLVALHAALSRLRDGVRWAGVTALAAVLALAVVGGLA